MKRGLPGHVPMLCIEMTREEAERALLLIHASVCRIEGEERGVHEDIHGAVIALEEALGYGANAIMQFAATAPGASS